MPAARPSLHKIERLVDGGRERDGFIGLDRNERLSPLPEAFLQRIRDAVTSDLLTKYPATDRLYEKLGSHLGLDRSQILLAPGSDGVFRAVFDVYGAPGGTVVAIDPSYAMYEVYAGIAGMDFVKVTVGSDLTVNVDELLEAIDEKVQLVCVANPNQPTGAEMAEADLKAVVDRAGEVGALVTVDEAYHPFSRYSALPWLADAEHLVVTRTFSKAWGLAGLRVGLAAGAPEVLGNLGKVRSAYDVNGMAARTLELALDDPQIAADYVAEVEEGRVVLVERSRALGLRPFNTTTNFVPIGLEDRAQPTAVVAKLRERGIIVKGPFSHPALAGCIRITLGSAELMSQFAEQLGPALEAAEQAG